ncbi:DUF4349 domain-containing protein [Maribacter halichondriae]|uniref:DUF4349 domain-containing protein n=1 Tax=Maribacter halichondriae TaxID=2980554 RepID=UPI00235997C2|nr:DUF4349 domain-containing protein [Maribacter sp. Hal144]
MKPLFKKRFKKLIGALAIGFILLFLFRLAYGYQTVAGSIPSPPIFLQSETPLEVRKNYASKKYKASAGQAAVRMDQKYEKIADIQTVSTDFDQEEQRIRKQVENYKALIQFENKNGNAGYRNLNLIIGVPPENFDSIYHELIKIGKVQAKQITKKDKTNEYKELNAKKSSLEKIRESLIELKSKGGKIDEYMQLENRILEIEQQLQELGVSLGNFDDENEFCTVKFSLTEGREITIGILQRIKVALEWTVKTYLMLMAALTFMCAFAYLLLLTIEKINPKTK